MGDTNLSASANNGYFFLMGFNPFDKIIYEQTFDMPISPRSDPLNCITLYAPQALSKIRHLLIYGNGSTPFSYVLCEEICAGLYWSAFFTNSRYKFVLVHSVNNTRVLSFLERVTEMLPAGHTPESVILSVLRSEHFDNSVRYFGDRYLKKLL